MEYEFLCKTFRCCIEEDCCSCPLYDLEIEHCEKQIKLQALSFITRQQAEIEELKKVGNKIDSLGAVATLMDTKERLVRVKNEWEREVRDKAVREFAEKILNLFPSDKNYTTISRFAVKQITKEMTEKEGGKG